MSVASIHLSFSDSMHGTRSEFFIYLFPFRKKRRENREHLDEGRMVKGWVKEKEISTKRSY